MKDELNFFLSPRQYRGEIDTGTSTKLIEFEKLKFNEQIRGGEGGF